MCIMLMFMCYLIVEVVQKVIISKKRKKKGQSFLHYNNVMLRYVK